MSIYLQIILLLLHVIAVYLHVPLCRIHVSSCSPTATSVVSKPIWCCVIDIMSYQKRQKGKFLPMRNSMLVHCGRRVVRARQLLALVWCTDAQNCHKRK